MALSNLNYTNLIDNRNQELINQIVNQFKININLFRDFKKGLPYWSIDFDLYNSNADIYAGKKTDDINSFTHELLHIIQEKNGHQSHQTLPTLISLNSSIFKVIFTSQLSTHINNVILHYRMYPDYINMGFARNKFVYDYYVIPKLRNYKYFNFHLIKINKIDRRALPAFLQLYFAYRFHPNKFIKDFYEKNIIVRYKANHNDLLDLLDSLCVDWENTTINLNNDFFNELFRKLDYWKTNNNYR